MARPSGADPARTRPASRRSTIPALSLPPDLALPLRQEVRLPELPWPRVTEAIRSTLGSAGFQIVSILEVPGPRGKADLSGFPDRSETLAERRRRSVPMAPHTQVSVYALLGAGLGLGLFDALAVQAPILALPWAGGAAAVAALFWYRYGRSFDSEVVLVVFRKGPQGGVEGPSGGSLPSIAWFVGRVRSDARGSRRTGTQATVPSGLARTAGALARDFQERLAVGSAS